MSRAADEITHLAFADVVRYRRELERMQADEDYRHLMYAPAREIIVRYHNSDGDLSILEDGIAELRFEEMGAERELAFGDDSFDTTISPRNNAEVLETYLAAFATPFRPKVNDLPDELESFRYDIQGVEITGRPHLAVKNSAGTTKFLYLLTSKGWSEEEKGFFISLLGEIVAANLEGVSPKNVEGLDCRTGRKVIRAGLGPNYRRRLEFIIEDLQRLQLV